MIFSHQSILSDLLFLYIYMHINSALVAAHRNVLSLDIPQLWIIKANTAHNSHLFRLDLVENSGMGGGVFWSIIWRGREGEFVFGVCTLEDNSVQQ